MKYLRLLRLGDHYVNIAIILASSVYLQRFGSWTIWWIIATTLISISTFVVNEIIDRNDVDTYSWNPVHIGSNTKLNMKIVWFIILATSLSGIIFSLLAGFLWWGIAMLLVGMVYSIPPFRFKGTFGVDIIAQVASFFFIPVAAPLFYYGDTQSVFIYIMPMMFLIWAGVFPYQLADYESDRKAGLRPTHVVIGLKASLWLGIAIAFIGIMSYFILKLYTVAWWTAPLLFFTAFALYKYYVWLKTVSAKATFASMQAYVRLIRPLSELFLPYLILIMLIGHRA